MKTFYRGNVGRKIRTPIETEYVPRVSAWVVKNQTSAANAICYYKILYAYALLVLKPCTYFVWKRVLGRTNYRDLTRGRTFSNSDYIKHYKN